MSERTWISYRDSFLHACGFRKQIFECVFGGIHIVQVGVYA
jgi:hypothetical protein